MIQDKLLKAGALIATRDMPHTPATGVIEVTKTEFGVVHFRYHRNGEEKGIDALTLPKSDAEYLITHKFWTDLGEVKVLPLMNESQIDGLHDEDGLVSALQSVALNAVCWLEQFDNEQVRAHLRQMLDDELKKRVAEMRGEARAGA